ncbi:MAG: hypothetical protein JWO34_172 [Arthrobacter sp.]|nr:hypothetical protein [Arthrobacter sp.]
MIQRRKHPCFSVDPFSLGRLGPLGYLEGNGPAVGQVRPPENGSRGTPAQQLVNDETALGRAR